MDTPLLPVPLEGPKIFVSHGGEAFPSLVIVLQGYGVTADLVSTTFISKTGITSSTFKSVPDVPFSSFDLNLPEGKFSALAANGNLCKSKLTMPTAFVARNGAVAPHEYEGQRHGLSEGKEDRAEQSAEARQSVEGVQEEVKEQARKLQEAGGQALRAGEESEKEVVGDRDGAFSRREFFSLGAIKTLSVALKEASALAPARAGPSGRRGSRPGHGAHPLLACGGVRR